MNWSITQQSLDILNPEYGTQFIFLEICGVKLNVLRMRPIHLYTYYPHLRIFVIFRILHK